ncbi:MAG: hypothetical protein HYR60_05475 [Acidobacteria bacterium]|nr:hypothetical protein [Acidobacteriota bacterium]
MASISCNGLAQELLDRCLRGGAGKSELLRRLLSNGCDEEFLRVVVEGLSDRFEPRLCEVYAELMGDVLGGTGLRPGAADRPETSPTKVYVLSRVTLGADVAITSVILDGVKKRFPKAEILFAASRKSWELFAADPRIGHLPLSYPRTGSLKDRLAPVLSLRGVFSQPGAIVIDPDSRITQLGLLPVCEPENYYYFPSRSYGGDGKESLTTLTRRWVAARFGVEASAYIAPLPGDDPGPAVTLSLGVGENPAKRIAVPFERDLLLALTDRGFRIYIDKGAGGEETQRVERAIEGLPVRTWQGAFAPFASAISRSRLYIGYDSAGQHVAAACGVPLVTIFAGFPTERMFQRWQPTGPGRIEVVRVDDPEPRAVLERALRAIDQGQYDSQWRNL